jgi:hypothetical protein
MATRVVTCRWISGAGDPLTGRVLFAPITRLIDPPSIVLPVPEAVELDDGGEVEIELLCTDSAAPAGWVWQIVEQIEGRTSTWAFELPAAPGAFSLADASPIEAPDGTWGQYQGPQGDRGETGDRGPQGDTGPQGPQGTPGPAFGNSPWGPLPNSPWGPYTPVPDSTLDRLADLETRLNELEAQQ